MPHSPTLAIDGGRPARTRPDTYRVLSPGASQMGDEEEAAVAEVLRQRILYRYWGSTVAEFEEQVSATLGGGVTALAVNSGSSALQLAFAALDLPAGSEVLMPTWGFISAATTARNAGLSPRFVPVDHSLTFDPVAVADSVTARTGAILAVHPLGSACDLALVGALARETGALVVEDVAQAHGGSYQGQALGTLGDVAAFSLQYFKLASTGEGGVVVTRRPELYARAFAMHDAAALWTAPELFATTESLVVGPGNLRMSEIEGALGLVQLKRLSSTIKRMREIRAELDPVMAAADVLLRPHADPLGEVGTALIFYCDNPPSADWVVSALKAEGVGATNLLGAPGTNRHWAGDWTPVLRRCGIEPPEQAVVDRDREVLASGVQVGIDPRYSSEDVSETRIALEKILVAVRDGRTRG
jgi:8-amino-3,8-dideoxy-alpha-D-manno-octulosonate transaminase